MILISKTSALDLTKLTPTNSGLGGRIRTAITGFGDQRNAIILHRDILDRHERFELPTLQFVAECSKSTELMTDNTWSG